MERGEENASALYRCKSQPIGRSKRRLELVELVDKSMKRLQPIVILRFGFAYRFRDGLHEFVLALYRLRQHITQTDILAFQIAIPFADRIATSLKLLSKPVRQLFVTACSTW